MEKIRIGVSSCLLGEHVRYDGLHKRDRYICDILGKFVSWYPVCPEVECGMPIPREAMRLVGDPENPKLMTNKTNIDKTPMMQAWIKGKMNQLDDAELCGFIFKAKSPSSGMERVKVYNAKGHPSKVGVGMFARAFMEKFPLMPVEEEGRLHDDLLRENFIERIFVYHRWRKMQANEPTPKGLVEFHTVHKYLVMSHNQSAVSRLGRIVADITVDNFEQESVKYFEELMTVLQRKSNPKRHCNVLMHIMGYFKKNLSSDEKSELLEVIEQYRNNLVPLVVPITLINHYVRKYDQKYLKDQLYLQPHPAELKLRNHV